jgi:hypothetical protein
VLNGLGRLLVDNTARSPPPASLALGHVMIWC